METCVHTIVSCDQEVTIALNSIKDVRFDHLEDDDRIVVENTDGTATGVTLYKNNTAPNRQKSKKEHERLVEAWNAFLCTQQRETPLHPI